MSTIEQSDYKPYVAGDLVGTSTSWQDISPDERIGSFMPGDPIGLYGGSRAVQWALAADELREKAGQAEAAGQSEDALTLYARADIADAKTAPQTVWQRDIKAAS